MTKIKMNDDLTQYGAKENFTFIKKTNMGRKFAW